MKRLIKKAFGKTLYHGTTIENLSSITDLGMILPNESKGGGSNGAPDSNYIGYVFLATTISAARFYAGYAMSGPRVILEVDIPEESLLPDDNDCPECKTWQESEERIMQVKVSGSITSDYFKNVYFYKNYGNYDFVFEAPFLNWREEYKKYIDEFY